jgi:carboxypeptidase Taq
MKNYLELEKMIERIYQINNAISILYWDNATYMPKKSSTSRSNEITTLSSIAHSMLKSEKVATLMQKAQDESDKLNKWQFTNLQEITKKIIEASCISDDLQAKHVITTNKCELVWREAKKENDYNKLKPYLQEVLDCTIEISKVKADKLGLTKYDALIDSYDPGRSSSDIKEVYSILKDKIPSLIQKIKDKQHAEKRLLLTEKISTKKQKLIARKIMEIMGFDEESGRLDESAHPFCGGTPFDVRLTNRYNEDNFLLGLYGIIHETGHGLYEQSLPAKYKNQPIGRAKGMAIHESQSLIMEMQIGRSKAFIEFLAKLLKDEFGFRGREYSSENLYKLINHVEPGFIRVDADEVTYPMHVILRFEIEDALINHNLSLEELPELWNQKMRDYLGLNPNSHQEGCLQDIHWPSGHFGYFPAYTNGAIIASMLMQKMYSTNSHINEEISEGNFVSINRFLDNNIRSFGSLKTCNNLIKDATGESKINPTTLIQYLENKYLD